VPEPMARWSAAIGDFARGLQLVPLAKDHGDMAGVAACYYRIGDQMRLDRLQSQAETHIGELSYWDRVAFRRMIDTLQREQIAMTREALSDGGVDDWLDARETARRKLIDELRSLSEGHAWSFAKFALAGDAVRAFRLKEA